MAAPLRNAPTTPGEARRRRRRTKNLTLMAVLLGFVLLVYLVSIVRMSGG